MMGATRAGPAHRVECLQTAMPPASRVVELDALRGLAALAVVAFHYTTLYGQLYGHTDPQPVSFGFGNYGVHLFFLISGFVIFMTLERTRGAMDFVVSRFSRLFPAYWAAILISASVVYTIGMPSQRLPWSNVAIDFTMLQRVLGAEDLDGSYWTLEVELFFYAQMLFWFALGLLRRIHWIIAVWLVLAAAHAAAAQHGLHLSWTLGELLIVRHIPFFALGILFYRLHSGASSRRLDLVMIAACIATIAFADAAVFTFAALACCAIFALFVRGHLAWLRAAPFAFFGAISYSLYLLHQAIGFSLLWHLEHAGLAAVPAALCAAALAILLATALTFAVERPVMRLIRAAWQRRRDALAMA